MSKIYRWTSILALLALLLAACQPVMPVTETAPATTAADAAAPELFMQGAALPGLMDITRGPDGNIYAASELGHMIAAVDPASGEIVARYGEAEGVDAPLAMTVGPDGSIYWTSFYTLHICRLTPEGEKLCQALPEDIWALAFAPDGRLFVSAGAHVHSIYVVDPNLQAAPQPMIDLGSPTAFFTFGPDGMLYVPMLLEGKVVRLDVNADPVTMETVAEDLPIPWSVVFDSTGKLYVATSPDAQHNAIVRVDLATGAAEEVGTLPVGMHTLEITADDRILAGHYDEGAIFELMPDGALRALTPTGLVAPGGLAVQVRPDGGESLFVADWKTLYELDGADGQPRHAWRSAWFPDVIATVRTVAVDGENLMISAWPDQWGGNVVQVWNPTDGSEVLANWELVRPGDALRFQGDIVLVEMLPDAPWSVTRVKGDDFADRHLLGDGFLTQPLGLAASDDDLWVTDYATGSVVQLVADGEELAEPVVVATELDRPEGLALAPDGRLLVVETGTGRLLAVTPATGAAEVIAEGLGFELANPSDAGTIALPPHFVFSGVAVGPSGNVYVAADGDNAIYRIALSPVMGMMETESSITGAVEEVAVRSADDMAGTWQLDVEGAPYFLTLDADGAMRMTDGATPAAVLCEGHYAVMDGKVQIECEAVDATGCPATQRASYAVFVTQGGDLRFELDTVEFCTDHRVVLGGQTLTRAQEVAVRSADEMAGAWQLDVAGVPYFLVLDTDGAMRMTDGATPAAVLCEGHYAVMDGKVQIECEAVDATGCPATQRASYAVFVTQGGDLRFELDTVEFCTDHRVVLGGQTLALVTE